MTSLYSGTYNVPLCNRRRQVTYLQEYIFVFHVLIRLSVHDSSGLFIGNVINPEDTLPYVAFHRKPLSP